MRVSKGREGIALLLSLMFLVVAAGVASLMFARTLSEVKNSADDAGIVQTLLLAQGGANLGGALLQVPVKEELEAIVLDAAEADQRWAFGDDSGDRPDDASVARELSSNAGSVANLLQARADSLVCGQEIEPGEGGVLLYLFFTDTACAGTAFELDLPGGVRLPAGRFVGGPPRSAGGQAAEQVYALPFVLVSQGTLGEFSRRVLIQGEYRFPVGRKSFASYGLFTNLHEGAGGSDIWFTEDTLFDGPVHTNSYFRFYRNPWFGGRVTSAGCTDPGQSSCRGELYGRRGAEYYGEGFVRYDNMNSQTSPRYRNRYGSHAPQLTAGVDWAAEFVPLPENGADQAQAAQDKGIYFDGDVDSLRIWAAGADGEPLSKNGKGAWVPQASYQMIESCTDGGWTVSGPPWDRQWVWVEPGCETYRYDSGKELFELDTDTGAWVSLGYEFEGIIYVNGEVESFSGPERSPRDSEDPADAPPAVASFAAFTLASRDDIRITGDLTYEDPPCSGTPTRSGNGSVAPARCDNLEATNVLGVYAAEADILIGNNHGWNDPLNAPENIAIHGVLMSGSGVVAVEDYNRGSPRGAVNLLGGIIEYNYGAFGTFDSRTGNQSTGFSRRFTYDRRMALGVAPPYFPLTNTDAVGDPVIFSFGQREQLY